MIFRSLAPRILLGVTMTTAFFVGCVDIPSEGHTPPDYHASIRVMYFDPAISGSANIAIASGPDFSSFSTSVFSPGSFGTVTGYAETEAGGKQLLLSPGDPDTSALSFASDQRGTLLVLPRPDVSQPRFTLLGEGRMFEAVGISGASRVRFINAITRGTADTSDVSVDVIQLPDSTAAVAGLAFRDFSDYVEVPAGTTVSFYLTRSGTGEVLTDVVTVTGASNTDHTVVGSGSADAATISSHENG